MSNFKIDCEYEEASNISKQMTADIMLDIKAFAESSYKNSVEADRDELWAEFIALSNVYMLGYISGVRAERKKKKGN